MNCELCDAQLLTPAKLCGLCAIETGQASESDYPPPPPPEDSLSECCDGCGKATKHLRRKLCTSCQTKAVAI